MEGCIASDEVIITFLPPVIATANATDVSCYGICDGSVEVDATGGSNNGYMFTLLDHINDAGYFEHLCAGSFSVLVVDDLGCAGSVEFSIDQPDAITMPSIMATPEICAGACDGSVLVATADGINISLYTGGTWIVDGPFVGLCAGTYPMVISSGGCDIYATTTITAAEPVFAGFSWAPDPVFVTDPAVSFTDLSSSNAITYAWDLAASSSSNEPSPVFTFPGAIGSAYEVCLTVTDANGCTDEACDIIVINDVLVVHVPNAFTPDEDGINDGFVPVFNMNSVEEYEFLIFDRWGEMIFQSRKPGERWNGTLNGRAVQQDVYVWKLFFKDPQVIGRQEMVGHVTVLR